MITFLQQSITNRSSYATTPERSRATHFMQDGGAIQPIDQLNGMVGNNAFVSNVPPSGHVIEPLGLPSMVENNEDEQTVQNEQANGVTPLGLPVMNFDPPGKKKDEKNVLKQTVNSGIQPLGLPSMVA